MEDPDPRWREYYRQRELHHQQSLQFASPVEREVDSFIELLGPTIRATLLVLAGLAAVSVVGLLIVWAAGGLHN